MTQVFKPKVGWQIFFCLFMIAAWGYGIVQAFDGSLSWEGRAFVGGMLGVIGLMGAAGLLGLAKVTVRDSGIEVAYPLKTSRVAWDSIREISRKGKGDTNFLIQWYQGRVTVYTDFLNQGEKLRRLLLDRVREPVLPRRLVWMPYQRFRPLFWGVVPMFLGLIGAAIYFEWAGDQLTKWLLIGFLVMVLTGFVLYSFGTFWVTDQSIRGDAFWGWRREIPWEQIVDVEIGVMGEHGEIEAILIQGVRGRIIFDHCTTPQYAQVRDLILRRSRERSQLL
jgi:hypothetical protein